MSTLYRDAAVADGRSSDLELGISVLVEDGLIAWLGPTEAESDPGEATVIDASGATIVPGMVDAHSHLSMPGGAHWIDRGFDATARITEYAEHNQQLLTQAGVRWVRDVGSPLRPDPAGVERATTLQIRDAWSTAGRPEAAYIRAAGTWISKTGTLPAGLDAQAADADELVSHAKTQLDQGADFLKLYLDGPDPETPPWTADEVRRVVTVAHERGARVTAHATRLAGARVCVEAAVDAIEHGFELDADVVALMAKQGTFLVSTLAITSSWQAFGSTTTIPRFAEQSGRDAIAARREAGMASVLLAHRAGVAVAAGTDFGGGSLRANQLAWEVEAMVEAGLEPWEAVAAATWRGGDLLGLPAAGRIEVGGKADFFLVHGDPLSDPAALWRVWRVAWAERS